MLHCFDVCIWITIWFESIYKYGFELYSIGLLYPFGRIDYFWFVQCNDVHWLLVTASCYNNVKHVFFIWSCWGAEALVKITHHRPSFFSIFDNSRKNNWSKMHWGQHKPLAPPMLQAHTRGLGRAPLSKTVEDWKSGIHCDD